MCPFFLCNKKSIFLIKYLNSSLKNKKFCNFQYSAALCLKRLICLTIITQHSLKNTQSVTLSIHYITQDTLLKNINAKMVPSTWYTNHQVPLVTQKGEKSHFVALFTEKDSYTNLQKKEKREAKATISTQFSALLLFFFIGFSFSSKSVIFFFFEDKILHFLFLWSHIFFNLNFATNMLESTDAAPEVPHPRPTRLPARRTASAFFFFFFFLGFAPTRLDSCRCGSIRAESASIRAESGWFGQNRAVSAISGRIDRRPIWTK